MGSAVKILPHYTYDDYLRWEGRWEIIEGIAYDMSPMASPAHQKVANKIGKILANQIDKCTCHCTVYQPIDLKITEDTIVNPDLLIICEEITSQYYDKPPKLVVEIISPSSRLKDTITKYHLYESFGIPYYMLADPTDQTITQYVLIDGKYVKSEDYSIELTTDCRIDPDWNGLFE